MPQLPPSLSLWIVVTALGAIATLALWRWYHVRHAPGSRPLPSQWSLTPRPILTGHERRVYRRLREALPQHVVLAKVPLVRFCQPVDPRRVRYWYELLGSIHVSFAICSRSGRVLAALDIEDPRVLSRRAAQIKESVLAACRIRLVRCPVGQLPSLPEIQLLVPAATTTAAASGQHAGPIADVRVKAPAIDGPSSHGDGAGGADRAHNPPKPADHKPLPTPPTSNVFVMNRPHSRR